MTPTLRAKNPDAGDAWTWTAIDADTKLCVSFTVGDCSLATAQPFMQDVALRLKHRVQLTTDGHKPYLSAIEDAFGADIDYAQLVKIYGPTSAEDQRRYSPVECVGCVQTPVTGDPDPKLRVIRSRGHVPKGGYDVPHGSQQARPAHPPAAWAGSGPGVDVVSIYAYPNPGSGAASQYWGDATLGGSRADVQTAFSLPATFVNSGYTKALTNVPAGTYYVIVYAHSQVTGTYLAQTLTIHVAPPTNVTLTIDRPGAGTGGVTGISNCPGGAGTALTRASRPISRAMGA